MSTAGQGASAGVTEPPFPSGPVEELLRQLARAVRAHQLYLPNNPTYQRAVELLRGAFAPVWAETGALMLRVTESAFVWEGIAVLDEPAKGGESLAWLCYKDGVRDLTILPGFEDEEVVRFLDIIRRARRTSPDEDDLLTMLWEQDFVYLRYRYVDVGIDGPLAFEPSGERAAPAPPDSVANGVRADAAAPPTPGVVSMSDFDATLYFLEEQEIDYLRQQVDQEYRGDLRQNVLAILFDVFETQSEHAERDEVLDTLEGLLPHLLSAGELGAVAYLLREAATAASRAPALEPAHRQRLLSIPDRLSEAPVIAQLVESLDQAPTSPDAAALAELFGQLRPAALGPLLAALGQAASARTRTVVEGAADRLAASHTGELVRLISAPERTVALEAMRRSGAARTAAAVAPLGRALADGDPAFRLAAVQALAEIGSPGSMQLLERVVEDADRAVRVAVVRALAARGHRAGLPRVEAALKGKAIRDADPTEKMAFCEAYGALAGETGIALLDAILNGRSMLGRREDAELRASAALGLGRIGTTRARESLLRSADDKDAVVRSAVSRASRAQQVPA